MSYKLDLAEGKVRFLNLEEDDEKILIELPFLSAQKLAQILERLWDALDLLLWESNVRVKDNYDPWKSELRYKIDGKTYARVYLDRGTLKKVIICSGSVPIEVVA